MLRSRESRLNDSGEDDTACVTTQAATHTSRGQSTTRHAHHAWKIHVGLDAPVWLESRALRVRPEDGARVLVVPPNVAHSTGAVGWSVALFVQPGTRGTPFRESGGAMALGGAQARDIVSLCATFGREREPEIAALVDETAARALPKAGAMRVDRRVEGALELLRHDLDVELSTVARALGVSLDRLTHLVSAATGMPLRGHVLWERLLRVLSTPIAPTSLAAAATGAGFADHAHMTRTYRRFLGRAPSEFHGPPRVLRPWSARG
jgi:AraC-like DNA-binding protein